MDTVWLIVGWFLAILFGLLTISMLMQGNWLQALVLFLIVLLCLPPVSSFLQSRFAFSFYPLVRMGLIAVLFVVFVRLLLGGKVTSIYASPEIEGFRCWKAGEMSV